MVIPIKSSEHHLADEVSLWLDKYCVVYRNSSWIYYNDGSKVKIRGENYSFSKSIYIFYNISTNFEHKCPGVIK